MDNQTRSAVIYARVSSENDRQDTTRQITDLQSYANRENIKIEKIFQEHISGVKKIEERAVLQECLDYCCNNHIQFQADGTVNPLASIIITVLAEFSNIERSNIQYRLNSGRKQYVANGGKLGRKVGYRKTDDEMKEQYKNAIALLKKGYSVRAVAKLEGLSHTTVQKLKNKFL